MEGDVAEVRSSMTFREALGIARRRFWWLIVPVLLGPVAGYMASRFLPPIYTSQAFVLVEQQKVPDTFVPSMVTDQLETRLLTLQDEILSRSRLQPIVEEFALYGNKKSVSIDEKVARLRKAIKVTTIRPDSNNTPRGFYVAVDADSARTAQQICTRVLNMFMEENLKTRSERAENTTDFLAGQLKDAKGELDRTDAELAGFKTRYMGRLPTDEQSNLQMLSTLSSRLDTVNEAIVMAQQQRASQMLLLSQALSSDRQATPAGGRPELERQLSDLRAQEASLEARYTADHPEIVKVKEQIASIQQQLHRVASASSKPSPIDSAGPESPQVTQLRASLQSIDEMLALKRAEQARLEHQLTSIQTRVQLSPVVEEQYKGLTRDYEGALLFYNDLLAKQRQSEMVTDLERRREGEQFRVMDAPGLPSHKSYPVPAKFAGGGLFAGLLVGATLAAFLDLRNRPIRTDNDVFQYLHLPVMAMIPDLDRPRRPGTAA